jgi:hypothetical protein
MRRKTHTLSIVLSLVMFIVLALYSHKHVAQSIHPTVGSTTATTTQSSTAVELASATCHMNGILPDPTCTPGATNPNVTQNNIAQTICVKGYTTSVRPPVSYTDKLKSEQMQAYGFTGALKYFEEDHLIPLELGGAPQDPRNLWPEPGNSPNPKDKVEDFLHAAVCAGQINLQAAQARIAANWTTAETGVK